MKIPYERLKTPLIVLGIVIFVSLLLRYGPPKKVGEFTCIANSDCESKNCINGYCRNKTVFCGDFYCDAWESCKTCPKDCGNCGIENGKSCNYDSECVSKKCVHNICRPTDPFEGDGHCDKSETCWSSPLDCGYCHWI